MTELEKFQKAIGDALVTDERGENLVQVARDAQRAEVQLAYIIGKLRVLLEEVQS